MERAWHLAARTQRCRSAGGKYAAGPVSLLSGLNPSPNALVTYFFMIALFGMGRLPWRRGVYGLWLAVMLLVVAVKIIVPIIQAEGIRCACCSLAAAAGRWRFLLLATACVLQAPGHLTASS